LHCFDDGALAVACVGMTAASAVASTPAAAPGIAPVSLPISSFYQIVADPSRGYLFISQGSRSANEILATNLRPPPADGSAPARSRSARR